MRFILRVVSEILFHVLYTLRRPVLWALRGLAGLSMFAALFYLVAARQQLGWGPIAGMFILSVVCAALAWRYDTLLLRLCPPGVNLRLYS